MSYPAAIPRIERYLNAHIRCFSHGLEQLVVLGIERDRPCAVDDSTVDVRAEVDLAHVITLQNGIVAVVWSVMSSTVIQRAACIIIKSNRSFACSSIVFLTGWKCQARFESLLLDQSSVRILQSLARNTPVVSRQA